MDLRGEWDIGKAEQRKKELLEKQKINSGTVSGRGSEYIAFLERSSNYRYNKKKSRTSEKEGNNISWRRVIR